LATTEFGKREVDKHACGTCPVSPWLAIVALYPYLLSQSRIGCNGMIMTYKYIGVKPQFLRSILFSLFAVMALLLVR